MTQSLVCFAFDFENGWNNLIYELSEKLEKLIEEFIGKYPDLSCRNCGCPKEEHYACKTNNPGKCLAVKKVPLRHKWGTGIVNKIRNFIMDNLFYKYQTCWCEQYEANHPRAIQMKEKYSSLHFYMTSGTPEMWDLIEEYERKSETICEICGQPGKCCQRHGWLKTLCKKCAEENGYKYENNESEDEEAS